MPMKKAKGIKECHKVVIYPGSFDPLTFGHINIIERGLVIFDKVLVAVANNTSKRSWFEPEKRVELIKEYFKNEPAVEVLTFGGLLVDYCRKNGIKAILRGLRTVSDFEFEFQMAQANKQMAPGIDTLFMMTASNYSHISSTILKEIIQLGGSGKGMIPPEIEIQMKKNMGAMKK